MRRSLKAGVAASLCALMVTSCASLSVNSMPLPGSFYQDGYDINIEFENVLNLPDRAKVVMDGATVGVVTNTSIASDHVDVTARIENGVPIPSNINAVLQQATVLGDIYLALDKGQRPDQSVQPLAAGGRIPVAQTTSPPQLEDTIANMANFIGSGSIQRAQNTIIGINKVTPAKDEVRRVVSQVTTDLQDLSNNVENVDLLLNSFTDATTVMATRTPQMQFWFTEEGIDGFGRAMVVAKTLGSLLPSLGTIYNGGYWLVPMLTEVTNALAAAQGSKQAIEREYPAYRKFMNEYFLPQDKYPAINITSIVGPDGRDLSGNVEQVLRMLGAVP